MRSNPTQITAPAGTPFIDVTREFDAPPELVFQASTDPDLVRQWLGPREMQMRIIEFDARTGGAYRYVHTGPGGDEYFFRGVFHTGTDNALIIQTFEFEAEPDSVALETMAFDDIGGGRTVLRQHSVFPTVVARDLAIASDMERGITDSMDRLSELLQTRATR